MRTLMAIAAATMVGGCTLDDLGVGSGVNRNAIFQAQSTDELVALGGIRLLEEEIIDAVAGQRLVEPNEAWTWVIEEDNTHAASADDGSWADAPGGQWQIVDDRFCRENEDLALKCSEVWQIGSFYRFTEEDGSLAVWTVTQG